MAKHDIDPVLHQLTQAINESAKPRPRSSSRFAAPY